MAASPLTPKKWALLFLLSVSTFVLWKIGAPSPLPISGPDSSAPAAPTGGTASKTDSKQCCDKAINRSSFLKQFATAPSPAAAPAALPQELPPPAATPLPATPNPGSAQ